MKTVKIMGAIIPLWLFLATVAAVSAISIVGTVYALVSVLNQYNVGYMQMGETRSFTILSTNDTISPGALNLSTVTMNPAAITANLAWKDDSGISRVAPLVTNGITTFNFPILGSLNLTVVGVSQGDFNITIEMVNSSSTFLNYTNSLS